MFVRRWLFLWMAVLCAGLGLTLAGVISYRLPQVYESQAVLEFSPRPLVVGFGFYTDESDWLTKRSVLLRVINNLGFGKAEGLRPEAALERLHGLIDTSRVDETSRTMVTLRVRYHEAAMARDLACNIVEVFDEYRTEYYRQEKIRMLVQLRNAVAQQEQELAAAAKKLEQATRDLTPSALPASPLEAAPPEPPMTEQELAEAGQRAAGKIRQENAANRVILREAPELPRWPVSPRLPLNLTIGALTGLALSPLLALGLLRARKCRCKLATGVDQP